MADLTMHRGDDRTVVFTFDADSIFEDGDVVRFTVKTRPSDTTAVVALSSEDGTINLNGGTATGEVPASATDDLEGIARLFYDWQLTNASGKTRTLDEGTVTVTPDITR